MAGEPHTPLEDSGSSSALPPAGWYPDPSSEERARYWDGASWTAHTAPSRGPAPTGPSGPAAADGEPGASATPEAGPAAPAAYPAPGGATTGYGAAGYPPAAAPGAGAYPAAPYSAPAGQRINGFAIASLILGIVWLYWIGSILALIFGYIAKVQIKRSAGGQGGGGLATAGIILGWIGIAVLLLIVLLVAISPEFQ
jgi:hypothetical protein